MASQELVVETLGEKHRDYNKKLRDLITTQPAISDINLEDKDVNNLLQIDLANHNKDVKYILEVLKCEDMLYVSRALSKSAWLVTEQKYADIINPDYLESELYPNMITKAIVKLKKYIRHNIKDEKRAEMFYLKEQNKAEAIKWLPYCSVEFIEINIVQHIESNPGSLKLNLFKRLCQRSFSIFEIITKNVASYERIRYLQYVPFFLNTNIDKCLDALENCDARYSYPKFSHNATTLIMKHSPKRVIDKIENYVRIMHIPTLVKYLKVDEISDILDRLLKLPDGRGPIGWDKWKPFIKSLPKEQKFEFVKKVGKISKENVMYSSYTQPSYQWYQFAPFEYAFKEITELISQQPNDHYEMISFLVTCADHNLQNIQTLLKYFIKTYKTKESRYKCKFVAKLLKHTRVTKYDENTWNLLNELLISMKIYDATSDISAINNEIVNSIIIFNCLNDRKIPEVIENGFTFNTLKAYKSSMTQEQQNKMFDYLYEHILSKTKNAITDENDFKESIETLQNILELIKDWDKSLLDYPGVLNKVRELINLKKQQSWKESMSPLYNVNKSWRKHMFEESVDLCPSEEVCLNALKHDPQLLSRHAEEIDALRMKNKILLQRLFAKLRVYWPDSLAQQWIDIYFKQITEVIGKNIVLRGLCTMLPQKALLDIIEEYKPTKLKIDLKQTGERVLTVQQFLAKNMHLGRPQPNPDAVLAYAKGDYLQFALPSLLAIFYNLKSSQNKEYIPKLLDAPVSVQKHGIRLAFKKLDSQELNKIFLNCWRTSKNLTIRTMVFKYTFELLCAEKDSANIASLWALLESFIDNLKFTEDDAIYNLLSEVQKVPLSVRAQFLIKSYNFLQSYIVNVGDVSNKPHYVYLCSVLAEHAREVMESISPSFIVSLMQEYIDHDFFGCENKFRYNLIPVISAYLLCVADENEQIHKYENVFLPLMFRSFEGWDEMRGEVYYIRRNFSELLTNLTNDLKNYVAKNNRIIPAKMFSLIQVELEKRLPVSENYMLLTNWKISVALTEMAKHDDSAIKDIKEETAFELGITCLGYLKNDVDLHFPCIYVLFSKSVKRVVEWLLTEKVLVKFLEGMLSDKDFIQGYLSAIEIGSKCSHNEEFKGLWEQVSAHPSAEVKMHYYNKIAQMTP